MVKDFGCCQTAEPPEGLADASTRPQGAEEVPGKEAAAVVADLLVVLHTDLR